MSSPLDATHPRGRKPGILPDTAGVRRILEQLPAADDSGALTRMLPPACYTDPEFFAFEQRAVFTHAWLCVGRVEQIPIAGDCLSACPAGEPILVIRGETNEIHALSAVCQHRGALLACPTGTGRTHLRCPLHFWTYDMNGALVGAPRTGTEELQRLRAEIRLRQVRVELWHGFIFVNLDGGAEPLAPTIGKVEPFWEGYEAADLVAIPPKMADTPLPWNWKVHVENFTDAYHPEFVHRGTHDFAPSVHPLGGVNFTPMQDGDNAILRTVPLLRPDGGMMDAGWGEPAAFPAIRTLPEAQRNRLVFVMLPPSMTMVFAPGAIAYTLVSPVGSEATLASSDRVTAGGWLLPRTTTELADFDQRKAAVLEGAAKIWAQDVPLNVGMQAAKRSRFVPPGYYTRFETTLIQFNAWLLRAYQAAWARLEAGA
jgi:phenylpropionate dioxygenase-like ring-hydroxylating dioxygenase large terminal subunit